MTTYHEVKTSLFAVCNSFQAQQLFIGLVHLYREKSCCPISSFNSYEEGQQKDEDQLKPGKLCLPHD
jgi:hypothetical protein